MARKSLECSLHPGERTCTLRISGEEDEVIEAAVQHATLAHGERDTPAFRAELRHLLRDEPDYLSWSDEEAVTAP